MADLLYDLLASPPPPSLGADPGAGSTAAAAAAAAAAPHSPSSYPSSLSSPPDADALAYLAALAGRPLASLRTDEPLALAQSSQSLLLSLQALARKSYGPVLESERRHAALRRGLPELAARTAELRAALPALDGAAVRFAAYRSGGVGSPSGAASGVASGGMNPNPRGTTSGRTASGAAAASGLARRRQALLLSRNAERLLDVLELPPLLTSATGSASASASASASSSSFTTNATAATPSASASASAASSAAAAAANYAAALDLSGHIRRLHALYPQSSLVQSVAAAADEAMRAAAASLVLSLKAPGLKLATSLRTISWLRRVLPDLEAAAAADTSIISSTSAPAHTAASTPAHERTLGAVFLACRLATLTSMLDALAPLRELADRERARLAASSSPSPSPASGSAPASSAARAWSGGQQTERYLKRYIEIFREQSFAIVSMFRSIFPGAADGAADGAEAEDAAEDADAADSPLVSQSPTAPLPPQLRPPAKHPRDPLEPLPPALAGFPLHLVDLLLATLRRYLPTVRDQAARDSLLTQVLYCAGSLGRLGADFGLFLATLDVGETAEDEWAEVVRRHRQLAGRLESIVGEGKKR